MVVLLSEERVVFGITLFDKKQLYFVNEPQWLEAKSRGLLIKHIYLHTCIIFALHGVCHKKYAYLYAGVVALHKPGFANEYWCYCSFVDDESMSALFVL